MSRKTQAFMKFVREWGPFVPVAAVVGYASHKLGAWGGYHYAIWNMKQRKELVRELMIEFGEERRLEEALEEEEDLKKRAAIVD